MNVRFLAPLDALRREALAAVLARPRWGAIVTRRDSRVAFLAVAGILAALTITCVFPAIALVLTPIALGVPHVASDARYLVLRRGLPRFVVVAIALGCAAMLALRFAEGVAANVAPFAPREIAMGAAWIASFVVLGGVASRAWARTGAVLAIVVFVGVLALRDPDRARLILAHAHNLVGVALWAFLFRRARGVRVPLVVACALAFAVFFACSGVPARVAHALGTDRAFGIGMEDVAAVLAPGCSVRLAAALASSYVLLQSVHYAVWLGWIPQDDVRAEGTLTFAMTARGLSRDFGAFGLVAIALAWIAVAIGALVSARAARDTYLSLASFHAYLELAMLAYFVVAGFRADPTAHPATRRT